MNSGRAIRRLHTVAWLGALALGGSGVCQATETYLLVVSGLGGEPGYRDRFYEWSVSMVDAGKKRYGLPEDHVVYLAEDPERDPERIQGPSRKDTIARVLGELAQRLRPADQLFVLFIGHGSYTSGESRWNLPGPDLAATELADLLEPFSTQQVVLVNTASSSGEFIPALSGKNRILITATKTGLQSNETVFGRYFVEAFAGEGSDVNKDGRVSIAEAFEYGRERVSRFYEENHRLMTEHALIDDNGDGVGAHSTNGQPGHDGTVASTAFLAGASATAHPADLADDPELRVLYESMRGLEERIELLKRQKESMAEDLYLAELERLLIELAQKRQAVEEIEKARLPKR